VPKIICPYCREENKPEAAGCRSCGLDFARWLKSYPGKSIPGWKPAPPARDPDSPAVVDPSRLSGLSPDARAAAIIASMEAEDRRRHSPRLKAGRRAGTILLIMGLVSLGGGLLLSFADFPDSYASMLSGYVGAVLLAGLAIGAYRGDRRFALSGAGFYVLDILISMTTTSPNRLIAVLGMAAKAALILALLRAAKDMD